MKSEILLIDDEKDIRFAVHEILKENNFFVREADTVEKAFSEIKKKLPDLIILDVLLDEKNRDGIDILKFIKSIDIDIPVIMISGHANIKIAVDSIKLGAFEFLEKPFNKDRLLNFVNRALENSSLKKENKSLKKNLYSSNELIGNSSTIAKLRNAIDKFSKTDSRILITGPAGSGKELVSRLIHEGSLRSDNPFKVVNGAILDPSNFNVIPIETPYLKDVKDDIPFLIEYFVKRISDSNGLKPIIINSKNTVFYDYDWPGNVRELRNLIERVVILASGKNEDVDKILSESLKISSVKETNSEDAFQFPLKEAREKFEKNYLEIQLNRHNGNVSKTADYIGMERSALHRKLKSLGIN